MDEFVGGILMALAIGFKKLVDRTHGGVDLILKYK